MTIENSNMNVTLNGSARIRHGDLEIVVESVVDSPNYKESISLLISENGASQSRIELERIGANPVDSDSNFDFLVHIAHSGTVIIVIGANYGAVLSRCPSVIRAKFDTAFTWKNSLDICQFIDAGTAVFIVMSRKVVKVNAISAEIELEKEIQGLATGNLSADGTLVEILDGADDLKCRWIRLA